MKVRAKDSSSCEVTISLTDSACKFRNFPSEPCFIKIKLQILGETDVIQCVLQWKFTKSILERCATCKNKQKGLLLLIASRQAPVVTRTTPKQHANALILISIDRATDAKRGKQCRKL